MSRVVVAAPAPRPPEGLRFEEVDEVAALDRISDPWWALWERAPSATPFSCPAWLLPWCRHLGDAGPWAILGWRGSRLAVLAPTFVYRAGAERVLGLLGGGVSDYQEVLAEDEDAAAALLGFLAGRRERYDRADLESLPPGSPLLAAAARRADAEIRVQETCPVLTLPDREQALETFVSHKLWVDVRRQRRRLTQERKLDVIRAAPAERAAVMSDLFRLHRERWRSRGGEGVLAGARVRRFHEEASAALLATGMLRLYAVRIAGQSAAALLAMFARRRTYLYMHGIDPALAQYSPGSLVIAHALEDAMREGAREVDFLRGREPYKYRWGAADRSSSRLLVGPGDELGRVAPRATVPANS